MIDGIVIGGMTYRIDPKIKGIVSERPADNDGSTTCNKSAQNLLDCLGLPNKNVKSAKIRKVTVDVTFKDEDC